MDSLPKWTVPATRPMALRMAAALSPEHVREILQINRIHPPLALALSFDYSAERYAVRPPGHSAPIFLMGVEPRGFLTGNAMVWMLGTPAVRRFPAATLRAARWGIRRAFASTCADCLEQFIPAWYGTGVRFCERLGFSAEPWIFDNDGQRFFHVRLFSEHYKERKWYGIRRRDDGVIVDQRHIDHHHPNAK